MRENEFEKRVQDKMSEFNLSPSEQVWKEVESRIRKEKKRRFIFWLPLLFLLVGGGIAAGILITNNKEKTKQVTADKNADHIIQPTSEKTIIPESQADEKNTSSENEIVNKTINEEKKDEVEKTIRVTQKVAANSTGGEWIAQQKIASTKKKKGATKKDVKKDVIASDIPVKDQSPQTDVPVISSNAVVPSKDSTGAGDIAALPKTDLPQENKQEEKQVQPTDSSSNEKKTKQDTKKTKKWDWGVAISAGRSSVVNGFPIFNTPLYADALSQGSPAAGYFSTPGYAIPASASWAAGIYMKRAVSKKMDIHLGLGYSYLSAKMDVGRRVDSTRTINNPYSGTLDVNGYYRASVDSGTKYNNRYHFISLSAQFSWKIINGKKIKVYWENGLSYNRLLTSTMLHFDRDLPGYYRDNKLLLKDQFFIYTGFSVPLSQRVSINPFATYGLTSVLKNKEMAGTHFAQFGIQFKYQLKKK